MDNITAVIQFNFNTSELVISEGGNLLSQLSIVKTGQHQGNITVDIEVTATVPNDGGKYALHVVGVWGSITLGTIANTCTDTHSNSKYMTPISTVRPTAHFPALSCSTFVVALINGVVCIQPAHLYNIILCFPLGDGAKDKIKWPSSSCFQTLASQNTEIYILYACRLHYRSSSPHIHKRDVHTASWDSSNRRSIRRRHWVI